MSEQTLELARRGYEAWNQGDTDWFEQNMTDDIEVLPVPELFPDIDSLYRGLDGWTKFWDVFRDAWSSIDIEASLTFAHWLTFRDGKLARLKVEMPDEGDRTLTDRG